MRNADLSARIDRIISLTPPSSFRDTGASAISAVHANTVTAPDSLVRRMRARTAKLHQQAEQSGAVAALLQERITPNAYALYLRNLLPAYQVMEAALHRLRDSPLFRGLAEPALYRAEAITADLAALAGPDWSKHLPLLPCGRHYAERIDRAAGGNAARLLAHCYTRYLGDLSGGQIIGRRLIKLLPPDMPAVAFTHFSGIADLRGFAGQYRAAIDQAGVLLANPAPVIEEAAAAFQQNIDLSDETDAAGRLLWPAAPDRDPAISDMPDNPAGHIHA